MTSVAHTQTITTAAAEIACVRGDAAILSSYLCQPDKPSPDVIQNIAACLLANRPGSELGPGAWKLKFSVRNGRPPSQRHPVIDSAVLAIAHGQAIPLGQYLQVVANLDTETRRALASALDPNPGAASRWRLKFTRAQRGFPRSSLHTELQDAWLGVVALSMHEKERKHWKQVYYELNASLKCANEHASPTLIKRAVAKVRAARSTNKKPPD